jgi:hypothetical protein
MFLLQYQVPLLKMYSIGSRLNIGILSLVFLLMFALTVYKFGVLDENNGGMSGVGLMEFLRGSDRCQEKTESKLLMESFRLHGRL